MSCWERGEAFDNAEATLKSPGDVYIWLHFPAPDECVADDDAVAVVESLKSHPFAPVVGLLEL